MAQMVKVGDKVMWRGGFGSDPASPAIIESIELCEQRHMKYGVETNKVFAKDLERCCVSLTNGHWCYGYQLKTIPQ